MVTAEATTRFWTGLAVFLASSAAVSAYSSENIHRTKAASEKQHDLWCYRCDTMVDGDRCLNLTTNSSNIHTKCSKEQKKCQVRRISVSTSTEEVTGRQRLWLLRRNCTETCEAGCIVIGERTKLHSCITCCDEHNFCNSGNSGRRMEFFMDGVIDWARRLLSEMIRSSFVLVI